MSDISEGDLESSSQTPKKRILTEEEEKMKKRSKEVCERFTYLINASKETILRNLMSNDPEDFKKVPNMTHTLEKAYLDAEMILQKLLGNRHKKKPLSKKNPNVNYLRASCSKDYESNRRFSDESLKKHIMSEESLRAKGANKPKAEFRHYMPYAQSASANNSPINLYAERYGLKIMITNILSPNEIWYRNTEYEKELYTMENELATLYTLNDYEKLELLIGERYMVKLSDVSSLGETKVYRCKLIGFGSGNESGLVKILTIDHGTYHNVQEEDIKSLFDSDYYEMNPFADRGSLPNLRLCRQDQQWSYAERLDIFEFLNSSYNKEVYVKEINPNEKLFRIPNKPTDVEINIIQITESGALEPSQRIVINFSNYLLDNGFANRIQREKIKSKKLPPAINYAEVEDCVNQLTDLLKLKMPYHPQLEQTANDASSYSSVSSSNNRNNITPSLDNRLVHIQSYVPDSCSNFEFMEGICSYVNENGIISFQHKTRHIGESDTLQTLLQDAHQHGNYIQCNDLMELKDNQPIVCRFSADKQFYRAKVLKVIDKVSVKVHYVDFGNSEVALRQNIHLAPLPLHKPILCYNIKLHGLIPINGSSKWSERALLLLYRQLFSRKIKVRIIKNISFNLYEGEVIRMMQKDCDQELKVSDLLIREKHASRVIDTP
ncbi:DgyrCDS7519 [Dimorphilus gyrociliatus]|uniref:DgyrCDS7519 n=1 Tax=Dimorphilus gyrociliatus TaxID=2664684 RepID=A0A7I8VTU2_9ANNE|nr:DgyrCDS7519 [Dimorphilus gyrociliatus]